MAGSPDFSYTVGIRADGSRLRTDLKESVAVIRNEMSGVTTPINLGLSLPGLDTGAAQAVVNQIQAQSQGITGLQVKTVQYTDELGNLQKAIAAVTGYYLNANGELVRFNKSLDNSISSINKNNASFTKMSKSADDWITRAQKMGDKERESVVKSATALQDKIKQYDNLVKAGRHVEAASLVPEINRLNDAFKRSVAETKRGANAIRSWGDSITNALKQTISYGLSLGLVRKAQQTLNEAIKFTIDLNTEMVKIQILQAKGAQTDEEIYSLAKAYNQLAIEMGATTKEVAKGSAEWLRQGKTVQETNELMRASMMLSKLGVMESSQATSDLTAVLNSFKLEATDAVAIVDKLIAVDNIAATSSKELSTAMRYVAAVAGESGVTFEQLVSYIAVMSQTTRLNAEQIGQSLKTIFTRMQDILKGQIDEDGLGINNVESALARVDIKLRDSETSFRDFGVVLEELAGKWDTLNEIEQANISKAIAGVRQANLFRILMTHMTEALEFQEAQFDSNGLAMERYEIHMESIQAKSAQFQASLEALYMEKGFQDLIKNVIDLGINLLTLVKNLGGLKTILVLATTAFTVYKIATLDTSKATSLLSEKTMSGLISRLIVLSKQLWIAVSNMFIAETATYSLSAGFRALGNAILGAISKIPVIGQIALVLGLVTAGISKATSSFKSLEEQIEKTNTQIEESKTKLEKLKSEYEKQVDLLSEYKKLSASDRDTTEEQERYIEVQQELLDMFPLINGYFDENGKYVVVLKENVEQLTKATLDQILADEALLKVQQEGQAGRLGMNLGTLYEDMMKKREKANKHLGNEEMRKEAETAEETFRNALNLTLPLYYELGEEARANFMLGLHTATYGEYNNFGEIFTDLSSRFEDLKTEEVSEGIYGDAINKFTKALAASGVAAQEMIDNEGKIHAVLSTTASDFEKIAEIKNKLSIGDSLTQDDLDLIHDYNITLGDLPGAFNITTNSVEELIDAVVDWKVQNGEISEDQAELAKQTLKIAYANKEAADALNRLKSDVNAVTNAIKEQNENGSISADTALSLVNANSELAQYITWTGNSFQFASDKALEHYQKLLQEKLAALEVAKAELIEAEATQVSSAAHVQKISALEGEIISLQALITKLGQASGALAGFGGGGGTKEDPQVAAYNDQIDALQKESKAVQEAAEEQIKAIEKIIKGLEKQIKAIDKEIDLLEDKKDAIEEASDKQIEALEKELEGFEEIIDARKKILELQREEDEYNDEIAEKNQDLADIQGEILALQFDDSQEARAKRLKLEEQAAEIEADITETVEDRKYDLQVETLDNVLDEYRTNIEERIELIEQQKEAELAAIDAEIEKLEEKKTKIQETIEAYREMIEAIRESSSAMVEAINKMIDGIRQLIDALKDADKEWGNLGGGGGKTTTPLTNLSQSKGGKGGTPIGDIEDNFTTSPYFHSGGTVESHHSDKQPFAGNLRSNEVFAKLLKGEYVATENQMKNFLKNILPKISGRTNEELINRLLAMKDGGVTVGDINISVAGNLDKDTVPEIKKAVFEALNSATKQKGKKTNAFFYSV